MSSDYREIIADRCQETVRELRYSASELMEKAQFIENCWQAWDLETLVECGVISQRVSDRVRAEIHAEETAADMSHAWEQQARDMAIAERQSADRDKLESEARREAHRRWALGEGPVGK